MQTKALLDFIYNTKEQLQHLIKVIYIYNIYYNTYTIYINIYIYIIYIYLYIYICVYYI